MNEPADEPPLTPEELKWLRKVLVAYRQAMEQEADAELPALQERMRLRLRDRSSNQDPSDHSGGRDR